jgi:hypothetical protein
LQPCLDHDILLHTARSLADGRWSPLPCASCSDMHLTGAVYVIRALLA